MIDLEYDSRDGVGRSTRAEAWMRFERALVFESERDIKPLRQQDFTWFHWHELEEEIRNRDYLKKSFEQILLDSPEVGGGWSTEVRRTACMHWWIGWTVRPARRGDCA